MHVVDASNPQMEQQMQVVYDTLRQLGVEKKPIVTLFNKQDKLEEKPNLRDHQADYCLKISAKIRTGLDQFREVLEKILLEQQIYLERLYPYQEAGKVALIRQWGRLLEEEFLPEGVRIKAYVPKEIYGKI